MYMVEAGNTMTNIMLLPKIKEISDTLKEFGTEHSIAELDSVLSIVKEKPLAEVVELISVRRDAYEDKLSDINDPEFGCDILGDKHYVCSALLNAIQNDKGKK